MRIQGCLIVTTSKSCIKLRPDEMQEFSGNVVVNEEVLGQWLMTEMKRWQTFADQKKSQLKGGTDGRLD